MPAETIKALLQQLATLDPDAPDVQFEAAIKLPNLDGGSRAEVVPALINALTTAHSLTRAHAAEGLGILEAHEAVAPLILALNDRYQLVRSYAARALGKIGDPAAIEPLIQVLAGDPFFGARAEAAEALRYLCDQDDSPSSKIALAALKNHREQEIKRKDERGRRVLAEIDLTLEQLGAALTQLDEALKENKNDYIASLLSNVRSTLQETRSRLGGLTATV